MAEKKYHCPVEFTLDRIGGKWKCVILWWLRRGSKRFGELMQLMPEISQKVLTAQLRELEADALIARQVFAESPPRVEYSLTAYGETLRPIAELMCEWGKANSKEYQLEARFLDGLTILAIGNEIFNQRMEGELGELRGANVVTASRMLSLQDLERIRPDLAIVNFEIKDDFSDLRNLISQLANPIPTIALTENDLDRDLAFSSGYSIHLSEPVEIFELVAAIANLMKRMV
ncbi:Transcriptional regulator [Tumidithrix helvetica PCC 7403]